MCLPKVFSLDIRMLSFIREKSFAPTWYVRLRHRFGGCFCYGRYLRRHFYGNYVLYGVGSGNFNGNIPQYITITFNSPRRRARCRPPRPSCDGCKDHGTYVSACCPASKMSSRSAGNRTLSAMVVVVVVVVVGQRDLPTTRTNERTNE